MSHEFNITIRAYKESDAEYLVHIFYNTCHKVLIKDYSKEQVAALAPEEKLNVEPWAKKWEKIPPFVAEFDNEIVGFAEFLTDGYIDCFYCHHDYIGKGVGTKLMQAILAKAKSQQNHRLYADVSETAKTFFEKNGFAVLKRKSIERKGIFLENYLMEKMIQDENN